MRYLSLTLIILITGCNSSDDNTDISLFNGLWKRSCYELTVDSPTIGLPGPVPIGIYSIEQITLSDGIYAKNEAQYEDSGCTIEKGNTTSLTGTYVIKEQVTTASGLTPNIVFLDAFNNLTPDNITRTELLLLKQNNFLYIGNWTIDAPYVLSLNNPYTLIY